MLEVFESHAGELAPDVFHSFVLPYLKNIATKVKKGLKERGHDINVPMTIFPRNAHYSIEGLSDSEFDVISIDWAIQPNEVRRRLAGKGKVKTLQGNLDPSVLFADSNTIRKQVRDMIDSFGTQNYICNLGHGMLPSHDPESLNVLMDEVRTYSLFLNNRNEKEKETELKITTEEKLKTEISKKKKKRRRKNKQKNKTLISTTTTKP